MGGGEGGRGEEAGGQTDWRARERVPLVKHLPKHEELSLVPPRSIQRTTCHSTHLSSPCWEGGDRQADRSLGLAGQPAWANW